MKFDRPAVVDTMDIPQDVRDQLEEYYRGTDQREILNVSYTRYPQLCNWDETDQFTKLDQWFFDQGISPKESYCIIYWNW